MQYDGEDKSERRRTDAPLRAVPRRKCECETDCRRSDNMEQGGTKEAHITGKEAGREIAARERSDKEEHILRRGETERYGNHINDIIGRFVDRAAPKNECGDH